MSTALVPYASPGLARRLLSNILALRLTTDPRSPDAPRIPYVGRTAAGVVITPDNAVTLPAVWAAIRYISQTCATPPWHVMKPTDRGGERADRHPLDYVLCKRPSPEWSSFQFRETLTHWALRWGNGYAEIERDSARRPTALYPIHPERVCVKRDPSDGRLFYEINNGSSGATYLDAADMFHIRGFGEGVVGVNVMQYAAESLGWAKAAQLFGSSFFGKGANPSAVVTMKRPLSVPALEELAKKFRGLYAGPKSEKTVFLDAEMEMKSLTIAPENAQFIETNRWLVVEIARWFGVPPHKIASLDNATYSNIEHQAIEAVQDSITPWILRFEAEADFKLMGSRGFYTKMNLNALLRGDAASRAQFYTNMRQNGAFSINDILALEDRPTIGPAGDVRVMQSQFVPIEKLGEDKAPAAPMPPRPAEPDETDDDDDSVEPTARAPVQRKAVRMSLVGDITKARAQALCDRIKAVDPSTPIRVTLDSKGGNLDAAYDIASVLMSRKVETHCHALSDCSSAALVVMLSATKRTAEPRCSFVLHRPSLARRPEALMAERMEGALDNSAHAMARLLSHRTGTSAETFQPMLASARGKRLTSAEAVELGIIHGLSPIKGRKAKSK